MDGLVMSGAAGLVALARERFRAGRPDLAASPAVAAAGQCAAPETANLAAAVLNTLGRYEEALTFAGQALRRGRYPEAMYNRIVALMGTARFEEALAAGEQAVAATDRPELRHLHGMNQLSLGRFTPAAWLMFEHRLLLGGAVGSLQELRVWRGEPMGGRTVLVHAEEGMGDTIQFLRYLPLVKARAGRVVVAVQGPLLRLMAGVAGADAVVAVGDALPAFDAVVPLLSLPCVFGTTLSSIPPPLALGQPFLGRMEPGGVGGLLRVGLAWRGNPGFVNDRLRSIPPAALAALAGTAGVQFFSLDYPGHGEALPPGLGAPGLVHTGDDLADTAAAIAGLDVVVSVDTAVAHLAASLGKPVLLLSRRNGCWRWLQGRADSPWYPTVHIFRQGAAGWEEALQAVRQALQGWGNGTP